MRAAHLRAFFVRWRRSIVIRSESAVLYADPGQEPVASGCKTLMAYPTSRRSPSQPGIAVRA